MCIRDSIYRWNYFYVPLKVGNDTYGVRVAVRDMKHLNESQIYNYGIKKDAVLPGGLVNGCLLYTSGPT